MVPLASLAAILVMVSYHMSEWRSFAGLLRAPKSDIFVLMITFALTVFIDLTVAVQVGVVASALQGGREGTPGWVRRLAGRERTGSAEVNLGATCQPRETHGPSHNPFCRCCP